ncbi:MAG TPA: hypothetical protein VIT45_08660 [Allosphingosinicella sp.]
MVEHTENAFRVESDGDAATGGLAIPAAGSPCDPSHPLAEYDSQADRWVIGRALPEEPASAPDSSAEAPVPDEPGPEPAAAALPVLADPPDRLAFDPVRLRARLDGWTAEKQRAFVEELAECGVVKEAAARVGMSEQSAFNLRRRADADGFNLAWEAAVRLGAERLRSLAYERAVTGTVKRHYYKGQVVGEDRVYDNRLLVYLLSKTEPVADGFAVRNVARNWESWMQAIEDGLDKPMPDLNSGDESPVWLDEYGQWWTSFPPPPGFEGRQFIPEDEDDDDEYQRECTPAEIETIEELQAREEAEKARRRALYFDPDRMKLRARR